MTATLTQNGHDWLLVPVPKDMLDDIAHGGEPTISVDKGRYLQIYMNEILSDDDNPFHTTMGLPSIDPWENWSIIGQYSPAENSVDFEVDESWVETYFKGHLREFPKSIRGGYFGGYWDYEDRSAEVGLKIPKDSFLSLLSLECQKANLSGRILVLKKL